MTDMVGFRRVPEARRMRRWGRRIACVWAAFALVATGSGLAPASAAAAEPTMIEIIGTPTAPKARPPVPDGSKPIAAEHEPAICSQAEYDAGASNQGPSYGYYWSTAAKAWVGRPRCYPRWGFLEMSPSQIVKPGKPVTFTAMPRDGSNSAQYAPVTGTISWDYSGMTVIAGCGASDLSCTVLPAAKAGEEWQWFQVHVSMPKTFYVDDPGEFCVGRHLCPGATTNAWGFVGIPPEAFKGEIYGTVTATECSDKGCKLSPLPGVAIEGDNGNADDPELVHGVTDEKGKYSLVVSKGRWMVTPSLKGHTFSPNSKKVSVADKKVGPIDFRTCATASDDGSRQISPSPANPLCVANVTATFTAPDDRVIAFKYTGYNFEDGKPVNLFLDNILDVATIKNPQNDLTKLSFRGKYEADPALIFSNRGNIGAELGLLPQCWSNLTGRQGRIATKPFQVGDYVRSRIGYIVYSTLRAFKPGDFVCRNEDSAVKDAGAITVIARETIDISSRDVSVESVDIYRTASDQRNIPIDKLVRKPLCLGLGSFGSGHILIKAIKTRKDQSNYKVELATPQKGPCPE